MLPVEENHTRQRECSESAPPSAGHRCASTRGACLRLPPPALPLRALPSVPPPQCSTTSSPLGADAWRARQATSMPRPTRSSTRWRERPPSLPHTSPFQPIVHFLCDSLVAKNNIAASDLDLPGEEQHSGNPPTTRLLFQTSQRPATSIPNQVYRDAARSVPRMLPSSGLKPRFSTSQNPNIRHPL